MCWVSALAHGGRIMDHLSRRSQAEPAATPSFICRALFLGMICPKKGGVLIVSGDIQVLPVQSAARRTCAIRWRSLIFERNKPHVVPRSWPHSRRDGCTVLCCSLFENDGGTPAIRRANLVRCSTKIGSARLARRHSCLTYVSIRAFSRGNLAYFTQHLGAGWVRDLLQPCPPIIAEMVSCFVESVNPLDRWPTRTNAIEG